jgi:hypothetical protein
MIDCRVMFRLHAMDLWGTPWLGQDHHWMLRREYGLRSWLAAVARDYGRLRRAGGDPFNGQPITGLAVIRALGLECCPEPQCVWAHLKFTVRMLVAATRESLQVQRELMWLERAAGSTT